MSFPIEEVLVMILNGYRPMPTGTTAGWKKAKYPLFEPALNTMFDSYVIKEDGIYKMWFSFCFKIEHIIYILEEKFPMIMERRL